MDVRRSVFDRIGPSGRNGGKVSDETLNVKVSHNIFITNFPSHFSVRELRNTCEKYGAVNDVFIPKKLSKAGKHFAFVRFVKNGDVQNLVNNLNSIWIGKIKLFAKVARFDRNVGYANRQNVSPNNFAYWKNVGPIVRNNGVRNYADVLRGASQTVVQEKEGGSKPVIVLDQECVNDQSNLFTLVACVKQFGSIPNIQSICSNEGFDGLQFKYLGGFWIAITFKSLHACDSFKSHQGIASWFVEVKNWSDDFEVKERVVWIDVEGIPLLLWTTNTFVRVARQWGDLVYFEDANGTNRYSVRMCVKTILTNLISESCKVVFEGKVTEIRAKEITGWVPDFVVKDYVLNEKEDAEGEDDVFINKDGDNFTKDGRSEDDDGESVHVPDSFDNDNREGVKNPLDEDPFGLDDLIRKDGVVNNCCSKEMANDSSFPPALRHAFHSGHRV
ncbi:hypothetical protein L2E82_02257 [Cichorium intybus]|uniref:Uncharacterized protein n=1 Tax=Cichorium intybus TaxID=13427 RepID=A0ACB9H2F9_CICIN|nr:hypothetical protein L2E82_02257 [Cichorium intybus]